MKTINISVVGDIMLHQAQLDAAIRKKSREDESADYYFGDYFTDIKKYIKNADVDIAICNFETTMAGGAIAYSGYPKFSSPERIAIDLREAGFDVACTANNHVYDTGKVGVIETKRILKRHGFVVSGTKETKFDSAIGYIEVQKEKIAIISYTYRSADRRRKTTINGMILDDESNALINSFSEVTLEDDLNRMKNDYRMAKENGSTIVIYMMHWGNEYDTVAQVHQRYIAYRLAQIGGDIIIGSHPHVCQDWEMLTFEDEVRQRKVPVFYSLGNFISNMRGDIGGRETSNCGMIANIELNLNEKSIDTKVKIIPTYVDIWKERGRNNYRIIPFNEMEKYIVHNVRYALERKRL